MLFKHHILNHYASSLPRPIESNDITPAYILGHGHLWNVPRSKKLASHKT